MFSLTLIIVCIIGLIFLVFVGIGLVILMAGTNRDSVSAARENWIQHRVEIDENQG